MIPVDGRDATVVHYGEPNDRVVSSLAARGARVHELTVYEWRLPADVGALSAAIDGMITGDIQVLVFTSQIQVRHLLEVAGPERRGALLAALNAPAASRQAVPQCSSAPSARPAPPPATPPALTPSSSPTARSSVRCSIRWPARGPPANREP